MTGRIRLLDRSLSPDKKAMGDREFESDTSTCQTYSKLGEAQLLYLENKCTNPRPNEQTHQII